MRLSTPIPSALLTSCCLLLLVCNADQLYSQQPATKIDPASTIQGGNNISNNPPTATPTPKDVLIEAKLEKLGIEMNALKESQLNQKIEKDLLREFYTENISLINWIASAILGTITLLISLVGYFGIRDIRTIKKKYKDELKEITSLKEKLACDIDIINKNHKESVDQFNAVLNEQKKQQQKISVLEYINAIARLFELKKYEAAIPLIESALKLDPQNLGLCIRKAHAYARTGELNIAITTLLKVLESNKDEAYIHGVDLVEYYLLGGDNQKAREAKSRLNVGIFLNKRPFLETYITALELFNDKNWAGLRKLLNETLTLKLEINPEDKWGFDDAKYNIKNIITKPGAKALLSLVNYIENQDAAKRQELQQAIDSIPS